MVRSIGLHSNVILITLMLICQSHIDENNYERVNSERMTTEELYETVIELTKSQPE